MRRPDRSRCTASFIGILAALAALTACGTSSELAQPVTSGVTDVAQPPFDLGVGPLFAAEGEALLAVQTVRDSGVPQTGRAARYDASNNSWSAVGAPPALRQPAAEVSAAGSTLVVGLRCKEPGPCERGIPTVASLGSGDPKWQSRQLRESTTASDDFAVVPHGTLGDLVLFELMADGVVRVVGFDSAGEVQYESEPLGVSYRLCPSGDGLLAVTATESAATGDPMTLIQPTATQTRLQLLDISSGRTALTDVAGSELSGAPGPADEMINPICTRGTVAQSRGAAFFLWDNPTGRWRNASQAGAPRPPYDDAVDAADGRTVVLTRDEIVTVGGNRPVERRALSASNKKSRPARNLATVGDSVLLYEHDLEGANPGRLERIDL